jgi:NAD(P)-dependent dehydrogenase (short-subunit alcohol dehydrogenase family)
MASHSTPQTGPNAVGHKNPATALMTGIVDLFSKRGRIAPLRDDERIDGKVCLVTGASNGLGKAIAIQLAERGGHVILACRSRIPEAGEEIKRASGSDAVEMIHVDLADLASVDAMCDDLAKRGVVLDIAVLNAGLMPAKSRATAQGHEVMFGVHFLANRKLLDRWCADGVLKTDGRATQRPRVIFVSSEAHQSASAIDFDDFGAYVDYGLKDGMAQYAASKLYLSTFASELSRRLNPDEGLRVGVHSLCPGPIASNIAHEAPRFLKPLVGPLMKLVFPSPMKAAEPVVYLACCEAIEDRSGVYLHMMQEKLASEAARDPDNGRRLWDESAGMI